MDWQRADNHAGWIAGSFALGVTAVFVAVISSSVTTVSASQQPEEQASEIRTVVDRYCVSCHNQKAKIAGLVLDDLDARNVNAQSAVWEKVLRKLTAQAMPPVGRPRPDEATYVRLSSWLESELDRAAKASPNPGRTETFHRLSRTEFRNVIRDLLALDVDVDALLPADDSSYGFDNIAGILKINQTRMERLLTAARKISRLAVGHSIPPAGSDTFTVPPGMPQYDRLDDLPFGTRGGMMIRYNFPQDGEYVISLKFLCVTTLGGDEN